MPSFLGWFCCDENSEICIIRVHDVSFPLVSRAETKLDVASQMIDAFPFPDQQEIYLQ